MDDYTVLVAENPPGHKGWPKWKRSAIVTAAGELYVPAVMAAPEGAVLLRLVEAGLLFLHHSRHAFAPAAWLAAAFPDTAEIVEAVRRNATATLGRPVR